MFETMIEHANAIEANLELQGSGLDEMLEVAAELDATGGGTVATALRGIVFEVGMHVEAMRDRIRDLRAACEEHPSRHQNPDGLPVMH